MSKAGDLARENYLWLKGEVLRTKHEHTWWLGYRAKKAGLEDVIPSGFDWTDDEQAAFHSGYLYRQEMYGD